MSVASDSSTVSTSWRSVREAVLARDRGICQDCGEPCTRGEVDVHHLLPRAAGGTDDPANLITLCDGCHAARHPNLQVSLSRRMLERWALRLARLLDREGELERIDGLPTALRLLGVTRLREGQLEAIVTALNGGSMIVVRPTGSGKTLCFQAPALLSPGTALVISPLKALMRDQITQLQRLKVPGTFINGDLGPSEKRERYELLEAGVFKFLYCAPERFNAKRVRPAEVERLRLLRPSYLIVDEAHCVNRWGDDFRPDYGRLGELRNTLGNPPVLAFTATAGTAMQKQIARSLGIPSARRLVTGADRPNIGLIRHRICHEVSARAELIAGLLRAQREGKTMVFVPTVRIGEELRGALVSRGFGVPFYHGKLPVNERDAIIGRFTDELLPVLDRVICTNAFGMGLDIPNVRLVINWQHPACVEDYLQEFGRAGRDRKPAVGILLEDGERDKGLLEFMARKTVEASSRSGEDAERLLEAKYEQIETMNAIARARGRCFRRALLAELEGDVWRSGATSAWRILRWVFEEKRPRVERGFCCDHCNPRDAQVIVSLSQAASEGPP